MADQPQQLLHKVIESSQCELTAHTSVIKDSPFKVVREFITVDNLVIEGSPFVKEACHIQAAEDNPFVKGACHIQATEDKPSVIVGEKRIQGFVDIEVDHSPSEATHTPFVIAYVDKQRLECCRN